MALGAGKAVARGCLHPHPGPLGEQSAMSGDGFSLARFRAVLVKEFIQLLRDRLTFAMMVGLPIIQLLLFGYAINADPRMLPTAVIVGDTGTFGRSIVRSLENTTDFSRRLQRGERPAILVEADATDPVATGNALASGAAQPDGLDARPDRAVA